MGRGGIGVFLCLGKCNAGLGAADKSEVVARITYRAIEVNGREGIDLNTGGKDRSKIEAPGQHSNDGGLNAVHVEGLADDFWIGVELRLPPGVSEEDDGRSAVERVFWPEDATHGGLHAEQLKEIGDDVDAGGGNGSAGADTEAEIVGRRESVVAGHILEGMVIHTEFVVRVGGEGSAGDAAFGGWRRDPHQPVRITEGQRAQQQCIDDAEDGCVGADAEGQNENGDQRESAIAAQRTKSIADILEKNFEIHESSRFALLEFCGLDGAEVNERLPARFERCQAVLNVIFDRHLDVRRYFGFEVCIERALLEESSNACQRTAQRAHGRFPSGDMARTLPITSDNRFQ